MDNPNPTFKKLKPSEMVDKTVLLPPNEDGTRYRARILECVKEHKKDFAKEQEKNPACAKFRCIVNNEREEVIAYNDICDFIEQDWTWDGVWKFRRLLSHEKVSPEHERYMGSSYNVQVEWESGEITWEPLHTNDKRGVYDTDPVTVAIYARENDLLLEPGWRLPLIKKYAKTIDSHGQQSQASLLPY